MPVLYNVTGGGAYCSGGAGVVVGLSGTEADISYSLYIDGSTLVETKAGTGAAISFSNQTVAGNYTVVATSSAPLPDCQRTMGGSATVSVNPLPTIVLGASSAAVCEGDSPAVIAYSATTNSPDQYSINFDTTAEGQGFTDVSAATLPGGSINLTVPATAAPATYNATLTVTNSSTGCTSSTQNINLTVHKTITTGTITIAN
ncbi:MAG: hypothetical protein ACK5JD_01295 [Mangrovibacterium sp.]